VSSAVKERAKSEKDLLQNQEDYHDEDKNDEDSGTHNHAPFLLRPLSLKNRDQMKMLLQTSVTDDTSFFFLCRSSFIYNKVLQMKHQGLM
jgi:hypothetical protein